MARSGGGAIFSQRSGCSVVRDVVFGRLRNRVVAPDTGTVGRVLPFEARPVCSDLEIAWHRFHEDDVIRDWRSGT